MSKKMFAISVALLTIFAASVFAGGQQASGGSQAAAQKKITIGLSEPNVAWPYISAFVREFEGLMKDRTDADYIVYSADGSIEKQINDINDLIVQEVDVILVCSLDGEAVIPALRRAYEAKIPVLAVSNEPGQDGQQYIVGYSGPDDYQQGYIAAEIMMQALGGKKTANIIRIDGTAGQSTTALRAEGFDDYLKEKGFTGVKILDSQPCDWDAVKEKAAMQAFINKYGSQIDGVFQENLGSAAAEAVRDAGLKIPVVCTALEKSTYQAIKDGYMYGTIQQSPYLDAKQAIDHAYDIVAGKSLPQRRNIIPMPIVTAANVNDVTPDF
jgi:ribose transport system substrate-binding protein